MRRSLFVCAALAVLIGFSGCVGMRGNCARAPETCARCRPALCNECGFRPCRCPRGRAMPEVAQPGPPTGTVAYPYYTTRGPRDFLAKNPPSIGP